MFLSAPRNPVKAPRDRPLTEVLPELLTVRMLSGAEIIRGFEELEDSLPSHVAPYPESMEFSFTVVTFTLYINW